jgi:hypothetical protein
MRVQHRCNVAAMLQVEISHQVEQRVNLTAHEFVFFQFDRTIFWTIAYYTFSPNTCQPFSLEMYWPFPPIIVCPVSPTIWPPRPARGPPVIPSDPLNPTNPVTEQHIEYYRIRHYPQPPLPSPRRSTPGRAAIDPSVCGRRPNRPAAAACQPVTAGGHRERASALYSSTVSPASLRIEPQERASQPPGRYLACSTTSSMNASPPAPPLMTPRSIVA